MPTHDTEHRLQKTSSRKSLNSDTTNYHQRATAKKPGKGSNLISRTALLYYIIKNTQFSMKKTQANTSIHKQGNGRSTRTKLRTVIETALKEAQMNKEH